MQIASFNPATIPFDDIDDTPIASTTGVTLSFDEVPDTPAPFQTISFDEVLPEIVTTVTFGMPTSTAVVEPKEVALKEMVAPIAASMSREHMVAGGNWSTWSHLRDYVVASIEDTIGAFPRNPVIEKSVFSSFFDRWGPSASQQIAQCAVEFHGCWWRNSPLSVQRFCKGNDPYFAMVIAKQLGIGSMSLSQ